MNSANAKMTHCSSYPRLAALGRKITQKFDHSGKSKVSKKMRQEKSQENKTSLQRQIKEEK
jgi:hypothetical protein